MFQSTRPRGARLAMSYDVWTVLSFNPRAREGRDQADVEYVSNPIVSIHAPARGATFASRSAILT